MTINSCTVEKYGDDSIILAAPYASDLFVTVNEKVLEGWSVVPATANVTSLMKHVIMSKKEQKAPTPPEPVVSNVQEPTQEPVQDVVEGDPVGLDYPLIKGFLHDKGKLEDYGKGFGIDLKKNKSFKNMLKDLEDHVG